MDRIEIKKTNVFLWGEMIGFLMGERCHLVREVSDADKRKIKDATGVTKFIPIGEITIERSPIPRREPTTLHVR